MAFQWTNQTELIARDMAEQRDFNNYELLAAAREQSRREQLRESIRQLAMWLVIAIVMIPWFYGLFSLFGIWGLFAVAALTIWFIREIIHAQEE